MTTSAIDAVVGSVVEVHATTCTLDCPDACSLAVTVTDGVITHVDAAPGHELTAGWICAKVKHHARRVYAPERVMTPLVRTGPKGSGQFRSASWDEVLGVIAGRITEATDAAGPSSIVAFTYNSSAAAIERASSTEALFAALGATIAEHTICAYTMGASWASVFGDMDSADPLDVVHAELVVIWGANPTVSNTHFPPLVQQAVDNGARVVVIDPRRTAMAKRADLHLPVLPGTDVVLALALAREWHARGWIDGDFVRDHASGADELLAAADEWTIERAAAACGLDPELITQLAEWWGTSERATLRVGWGQERNANGGAACRAILALPVLGGHFGRPGTGVIGSTGGSDLRPRRRWPSFERRERRSVPLHQVGAWLAPDGGDPCRVLFIQGANPVVMCPDHHAVLAAFAREDVFTVVHDQVMTDTARYADIVLPATTSFEITDVTQGYGSYAVLPVRPVIDRVGESRSNDEVGIAIAQALGFPWSAAPLEEAGDLEARVVRTDVVQFVTTHPHDGRARLVDPVHGVPTFVPIDEPWPLTLISPASSKLINSMFGEFQSPSTGVAMHPDDATARGLADGADVWVLNDLGRVRTTMRFDADTRRGVVVMSKGVWLREHGDGRGVNVLTPATGDALVNGACFNDARVEVAAATEAFEG